MKVLGVMLILIGIIMIIGYMGYLIKANANEQKATKLITIIGEWISFSPFTIGLLLMGIGLLLILK